MPCGKSPSLPSLPPRGDHLCIVQGDTAQGDKGVPKTGMEGTCQPFLQDPHVFLEVVKNAIPKDPGMS